MLNIYNLHTNPEQLTGYADRVTLIPELAYEHAISIGKRFPAGESAIKKDPRCAVEYAIDFIK
jgi:hypothetical protein